MVQETDAAGLNKYYEYDADGNMSRVQNGDGTVEENTAVITEATYDFRGNPLTQTTYIRSGDLAGNDNSDNSTTALTKTYRYDLEGRLISETTPDGVEKSYQYDALGNLISSSEPIYKEDGELLGTAHLSAEYDFRGNVVKSVDALGAESYYEYDALGNRIKAIDPLGNTELYQYDRYNLKTAEVTRANYEPGKTIREMARTEYTYDNAGRILQEIQYLKKDAGLERVVTQTYHYSEDGAVEKIEDASGNGILYTYHPNGKVAAEITAGEQQTRSKEARQYLYDIFGNITKAYGYGRNTSYVYDAAGRPRSAKDDLGILFEYTYDNLGRRISETDGNGNTTFYTYNAFGLTASQTLPGDETIGELTVFMQYDRAGNLAAAYDTAGNRSSYTYDSRGNLLSETVTDKTTGISATKTYNYDLNNNLIEEIDAAGNKVVSQYDALGRAEKNLWYAAGSTTPKTTEYTYDADGNCTVVTDFAGNTVRSVYDSLGRLTEQYDALGNLVSRNTYDGDGRRCAW